MYTYASCCCFRTQDDQTPLELATINGQNIVVEELCKRGVDMAVPSSNSESILWLALTTAQEDIASTLVKYVDQCPTVKIQSD